MAEHIDVMISSTALDLPDHREQAKEACLRQGMHPTMMEYLPASGDDAIKVSLEMVEQAEIYLGIFAYRYGFLPPGHDISITEMEYNRAKERGIPRLIFFMHEDHPTTPKQMREGLDDPAEEARRKEKLRDLKKRIGLENIVKEFKNPDDFRALVIDALSKTDLRAERKDLSNLHSAIARQIPTPPEPYIAHRYSLLETRGVIGRQVELNLLTGWITGKHPNGQVSNARILSLVAVGGMGKSALTWKWFNEIAPNERPDLKGRLWWSFYESDAGWENFILRTLAYVSGRDEDDLRKNTKSGEREDTLLGILDKEPYLLALDGLERILIAYARMDAAHMDDVTPDKDNLQLRKTAVTRAGIFLRRLAGVNNSRILITTRLRLADLETGTRDPLPGTYAYELRGLSDDDAVALWRESNVSGTREELLRLFHTFENYPLLIRALEAEVADFRRAPRNFDAWRKANPDFDPFQPVYLKLSISERKGYIFKYSLQGLTPAQYRTLEIVAAFRMPTTYETLVALLVKNTSINASEKLKSSDFDFDALQREMEEYPINRERPWRPTRPLAPPLPKLLQAESELDSVLSNLEDRGLLGWDRVSNRYDLHPIVRGVIWSRLNGDDRRKAYAALYGHFASISKAFSGWHWEQVERFEDLTPVVEIVQSLIGLGRYDDAYLNFCEHLNYVTLYRLSASRQRAEILEQFFPDGLD